MTKYLPIAASVLLSLNALACPDLTGDYKCLVDNEEQVWKLRQYEENGVTVYYDESEPDYKMIADGIEKPLPDQGYMVNGTLKVSCIDSALTIRQVFDIADAKKTIIGKADINGELKLTPEDQLSVRDYGFIQYEDEKDVLDETMLCERILE